MPHDLSPDDARALIDSVRRRFHAIEARLDRALPTDTEQAAALSADVSAFGEAVAALRDADATPETLATAYALAERVRDTVDALPLAAASGDLGAIRGDLDELQRLAGAFPRVASLLGVDAEHRALTPPERSEVAEPSDYVRHRTKVDRSGSPRMLPAGSREVLRETEDGTLVPRETLGKLRLRLRGPDGATVPRAPFRVLGQTEDGTMEVLAHGASNEQGYAALVLGDIEATTYQEVFVTVGAAADAALIPVLETHLSPGAGATALDVAVDGPTVAGAADTATAGTVQDPDAQDAQNDPATFVFQTGEKEGNCCITSRPEIAARQYHFRQVVRIDAPSLSFLGQKPHDRREVTGPVHYLEDAWQAVGVMGSTIVRGRVNHYSQAWYPIGQGLGRILYSLTLAPCEQVNLATIDWARSDSAERSERISADEALAAEILRDRTIEELVESVLDEEQSGSSFGGGISASASWGPFQIGGSAGGASSSSEGRRDLVASTIQNVADRTVQQASAMRSQRATVVTTSAQGESDRIQTRTVRNHNKNHALTVQYHQVLSHYRARTELIDEQDVLLIPYHVGMDILDLFPDFGKLMQAPSRPLTRFLDHHRGLLSRMVPARYLGGFDALSRLLHCPDGTESPFATCSRWRVELDEAYRTGVDLTIETTSGRSVPLIPRQAVPGGAGGALFDSDPVRIDEIERIRVHYDPARAVLAVTDTSRYGSPRDGSRVPSTGTSGRGTQRGYGTSAYTRGQSAGTPSATSGAGGSSALGALIASVEEYTLSRLEVTIHTDPSRFIADSQTFRQVVPVVVTTLSETHPSTAFALDAPQVTFDGVEARKRRDYCALKELATHIQAHPMRYLRAIWSTEDPDRRALRLDTLLFDGEPLMDQIANRVVGMMGNMVAFPLLEGHRIVPHDPVDHLVSERLVSLPTRGLFAETYLSCCNATEVRDVTRVIDPGTGCQVNAPDITGVTPGSRNVTPALTPTPLTAPIVSIQTPAAAPEPTGLTGALGVMKSADIFRDMSMGAKVMDYATKMGLASIKSAGETPSGGGSTPKKTSLGGSVPGTLKASVPPSHGLVAANAAAVRQTPPQQLFDHARAIQHAVGSGALSAEEGAAATNALYTGGLESQEVVVSGADTGPSIPEPRFRTCCIFSPTVGGRDNIVEIGDLDTHSYGPLSAWQNMTMFEKNGLLYTCNGGFLDLGHIRDMADWTGYLSLGVRDALGVGGDSFTMTPEAAHSMTVTISRDAANRPGALATRAEIDELEIALSQRIAYDRSVWHEIWTWFVNTPGARNSSFSPEDNVSNLLGTFVGADAIRSGGAFDEAVVAALAARIQPLGPVDRATTTAAFNAVAPVWTDPSRQLLDPDYLQRRHMDAFGTVTPWLVAGVAGCASPTAATFDVPDTFTWPSAAATPLSEYYTLEIAVDTSIVPPNVLGGRTTITSADFPDIVREIRALVLAEFGPNADQP